VAGKVSHRNIVRRPHRLRDWVRTGPMGCELSLQGLADEVRGRQVRVNENLHV
jgi:hypothetical protein